jgi:hypothetical protein
MDFLRARVLRDKDAAVDIVEADVNLAHHQLVIAALDGFGVGGGDHDVGAVIARG